MSEELQKIVFYDKKPRNYPDEFSFVTVGVFDGVEQELYHNAKTGEYQKRALKGAGAK